MSGTADGAHRSIDARVWLGDSAIGRLAKCVNIVALRVELLSESARVSTAAEARFRIDKPNSRPRAVKVIALDSRAEAVMASLAQHEWNGASFLRAGELTETPGRLDDEIDQADLVIMLATAGEPAAAVERIGQACSGRRVTTTGLILGSAQVSDDELSRTLSRVRPWTLMLVIASSTEYVEDMLRALRA